MSIYEGFPWTGQWWPDRPFMLRTTTFGELCEATTRAARLVLAACARRAGTAGELREALGVPPAQVPLLDPDEPVGAHLLAAIRPDIVTENGVPKFVEINIEGSVGGVPRADLLAARFLARYRGLTAPPPATEARSASIRASLGLAAGAHVVIPAFSVGTSPGLEDHAAFIKFQAPVCESLGRHGLDAVAFPLDRLAAGGGGRLVADGRVVDGVFRLFDAFSQPDSPGLAALTGAVRARTTRMYTSEATFLLSNKMVLAWLWADLGQAPGPDGDFVRRHIPWTAPASTVARAHQRRAELVLKPAGGYGGAGVVLGPAVTPGQWRRALNAATGTDILQRYVAGDQVTLEFSHAATGRTRTASVPFVLGPFVFGGRAATVFVRHGTPESGPVLSTSRGAFPNTALLTDGDAADL